MTTETQAAPKMKTYVLLPHTRSSAPVYQRINQGQRMRIEKRPIDHAYLQATFNDAEGKNKTIRLKLNCNEIDLHKQVKDFQIPANQGFTPAERDAVRFTESILMTNNPVVQTFLESHPQYDKFQGTRPADIPIPLYTLYDRDVEIETDNQRILKGLAAANKVAALDLKGLQALMVRLNGSFFTPPAKVAECQNMLMNYIDNSDDQMLDDLLREENTLEERVTVLIGKAIQAKVLSFDHTPNFVVKFKGANENAVIPLKEIPSSYSKDERVRHFTDFLASTGGKLTLEDLEREVAAVEAPPVKAEAKKETKVDKPKTE